MQVRGRFEREGAPVAVSQFPECGMNLCRGQGDVCDSDDDNGLNSLNAG